MNNEATRRLKSEGFDGTPLPSADEDLPERMYLWPTGEVPGESGPGSEPVLAERSDDPELPDRFLFGIDAPYMMVQRPEHPNGIAILVIPGGGYGRLMIDREGTALVPEFVDQAGATLFVLRHRLPAGRDDRQAAQADAQRALRTIRANAERWQLDPDRIGVMGFSAGGHVAARLSTQSAEKTYPARDDIDAQSARPDFAILVYAVIDMGTHANTGSRQRLLGPDADDELTQEFSLQTRVDAETPPTFLVHAQDDQVVSVQNSLMYFSALTDASIPAEMHLFPQGGHGFGVRVPAELAAAEWPQLALRWLERGCR